MASRKVTLGSVDNHEKAGNVVAELRLLGFPAESISVIFSFLDDAPVSGAPRADAPKPRADCCSADEVGFFSNVCALTLPRVGRVIAAGAVATWLMRDQRDLARCLDAAGVSMVEAKQYERDLRSGMILIGAHTDHPGTIAAVKDVFARNGVAGVLSREEITVSYRLRRNPAFSQVTAHSR